MGSQSDWATMKHAAATLDALGIAHDDRIISAHRTPQRLYDFATSARASGFKVIIAGAGGAAHLPGMTAAMTSLPVFGVPVESKALVGPGFAAVDRPDAGRHSGRNPGHRQGRRHQCRPARRQRAVACDAALAARLEAWRAAQTAAVAEQPEGRIADADCTAPCRPARPSASWAADSLPACWRWPPRQLGLKCHIFAPEADSPAFQVAAARTVAAYTDFAALDGFRRQGRRRHL